MAKAGDKGIWLGDYFKQYEQPEVHVRAQFDRRDPAVPYTWVDPDGHKRASDDGGELPPKNWWLSKYTKIDHERHSVEGLRYPPFFPPMSFVRIHPAVAADRGEPSVGAANGVASVSGASLAAVIGHDNADGVADVAGTLTDTHPRLRLSRQRKNQGNGPQRRRARAVLKRMFPNGYPTEEEVSTPDLWDRFGAEYARVEGKEVPPSKLGMPSIKTVLREVGRTD